jgi:DNA mismatch endonuclease (patch repair protein)
MSRIRAKDTKPELALRRALSNAGVRGYRLNPKNIIGRPDICFVGKKVAVFVHGCYWHRCPYCQLSLPKSHSVFWSEKFKKNVDRDKNKEYILKHQGWKVLVFWECKIKTDAEKIAAKINKVISKRIYGKDQCR